MMTHLVKIGNSQGIRIPKAIIEQSDFTGKELKLELVPNGLLISPKKQHREGWKESIEQILLSQNVIEDIKEVDQEWLDATLTADDELECDAKNPSF